MLLEITRKSHPELFDSFIEDFHEISYEQHRRDATFFRQAIVNITPEAFPDIDEELYGFWETNMYTDDATWGCPLEDIRELKRVEKVTELVPVEKWIPFTYKND